MGACQSTSAGQELEASSKTREIQVNSDQTRTPTQQLPQKHPASAGEAIDTQTKDSDVSSTEMSDSLGSPVSSPNKKEKVRRGYSSGGSSSISEEDVNVSAHNHLVDWKNELSAHRDLNSAVVHIETDYGRPIDEIYEGVHDGPVLGTGVSGIVRRVKHRQSGISYAVKCLDLGLIRDERGLKALHDEIFIMCQLDHPNIVRLEEVYESDSEIYLIQELCLGGDLFDRLDEQSDYHYSEGRCAKLVKQMLSSVRYLHSKNIIHRDLKLENFLFSSTDPDSALKMIDFGLSKHFTYLGEVQHECVGTPYTVAPEVIRAEYDEKIDIWALGVITYLLLSGETPFGGVDGECLENVRTNILGGKVVFEPTELWQHVSEEGKLFVKRLLNPQASKRPTSKEAQLDKWLQKYAKKGADDEGAKLSEKTVQALMEFREYSDMRKVLCEVLSFTLLPEQIVELRKEFEEIDHDGDGEISLSELKQVLVERAEAGSLGALTEDQVADIFNALRLRKTEPAIRWHEFIAAGLSQCNFDERNLKLAFDRLDYDRKGFITLEDMKDILGNDGDDEKGDIMKIWKEGVSEFACPLGRITYDDFRMMLKGQAREREHGGVRRRLSAKRVLESSSLQAVPEGSMSPQAKQSIFAKFDEISALERLNMPRLDLGGPAVEKMPEVNIQYPPDDISKEFTRYRRTRSGSLGNIPAPVIWHDPDDKSASSITRNSPRRTSHVVLRNRVIGEEENAELSLDTTQSSYKKHHEFRLSVLQASKVFEQKRTARKMKIAASKPLFSGNRKSASLIMRRGSASNKKRYSECDELKLPVAEIENTADASDSDEKQKVEDASKRSGRPRKRRQRTASDISGMLR